MSSNESALPPQSMIEVQPSAESSPPVVTAENPDNPPWGIGHALVVWFLSVAFILFVPLAAMIPYIVVVMVQGGNVETLAGDPQLIFLSILAVIPAHLLTLLVAWLVITNRGRRSFFRPLGWTWPSNFGAGKTIGLTFLLLGAGWLITWLVGGAETQLDQIIKSSLKARYTTAFLAAITAPFVEEVVYRGILYSALQRLTGTVWAVVVVSVLFAGIHVFQYYNNLAVVSVITILSVSLTLLRAKTGRLLPCYVMHLIFNGIQAAFLILQPFLEKYVAGQKPVSGFVIQHLPQLLP